MSLLGLDHHAPVAPLAEPVSTVPMAETLTRNDHYLLGEKIAANRPVDKNPQVHGHIPDAPVGSMYKKYKDLAAAGVHATISRGIHGNRFDGALSIVMSGGYEDDDDHGETFTYTGEGGRDSRRINAEGKLIWGSGNQIKDQVWEASGNNALRLSSMTKKPVRVIRGRPWNKNRHAPYAPPEGELRYCYDSLYVVENAWQAPGKTDFVTCRFSFRHLPDQLPLPPSISRVSSEPVQESHAADAVLATPGAGPSTLTPGLPRQPRLSDIQVKIDIVYETEEESDTNTASPNPQTQADHPAHTPTPDVEVVIEGQWPYVKSKKPLDWSEGSPTPSYASPARLSVDSHAALISRQHQSPAASVTTSANTVKTEPEPIYISSASPSPSSRPIQRRTKRRRGETVDSTSSDDSTPPRKRASYLSHLDRLAKLRLLKERIRMRALREESSSPSVDAQLSTGSPFVSMLDQLSTSSNYSTLLTSSPESAITTVQVIKVEHEEA